MKNLVWAALGAVVLSGCGTLPAGMADSKTFVVDQEKMASVERAASKNGVKVIWVSAPRRPATTAGG